MNPRRRFLSLGLTVLVGLGAARPAAAAEPAVAIALSDDSAVYRETAAAIEQLAGIGAFRVLAADDLAAIGRETRLVIAVGTRALDAVLGQESKIPVLAVLVPRDGFERRLPRGETRPVSAVFIDQPVGRQLDLLNLALPERRRVGLIVGPASQKQVAALQVAAATRGQRLVVALVSQDRELFPAIERVIAESDLLLALPDPMVFNAGTIQNILLAAYRRQVPLIGFSPAYLRAGALLTLQSSPAQVAATALDAIRAALAGKALPPARFPREFSVTVNRHVARSFGLRIDDDAELTRRLQALEGGR